MSAKTILHQAMLNEWVVRIAEQKASGLNVSDWCIQNGLTKDKYFYWKRKIKDELITQTLPEIVPLSLPASPDSQSLPAVPAFTAPVVATTKPSGESCTTCATCTTDTPLPSARISFGDFMIELDSSAPERLIKSIIKAVRHA